MQRHSRTPRWIGLFSVHNQLQKSRSLTSRPHWWTLLIFYEGQFLHQAVEILRYRRQTCGMFNDGWVSNLLTHRMYSKIFATFPLLPLVVQRNGFLNDITVKRFHLLWSMLPFCMSVCLSRTVLKQQKIINTISFACDRRAFLPDNVKIWLTSVNPFLPNFAPEWLTPVYLSVGDIRWQITIRYDRRV